MFCLSAFFYMKSSVVSIDIVEIRCGGYLHKATRRLTKKVKDFKSSHCSLSQNYSLSMINVK